jgi:hypothetical protein
MTDLRQALVPCWQRMAGQRCLQAATDPGLTGSRDVVVLGREPPDPLTETPDE